MDQQDPGVMKTIVDYLRRRTGMTGTADPSVAGAAQTLQQQPGLREMQIRAAEAGLPLEEYVRVQQQGQMPR
jgi:hypothetical protein